MPSESPPGPAHWQRSVAVSVSMAERGILGMVVHTMPPPMAMSPPRPGVPKAMLVAAGLLATFALPLRALLASRRVSEPSPWFKVQMTPDPAVRNRGPGPVGTVVSTLPVTASTAVTSAPAECVIQIIPSL